MTSLKWAALVLIVGWAGWIARLYRILHQQEPAEDWETQAEDVRRRAAIGHVTTLEAHREWARHDEDRSARWAARRR